MANFYVRKSGSDSNNGTSPATAWLTIGKALGASGISSGDTVYIGSGVYRESITANMPSATSETLVVGDTNGAYTGDVGEVQITAYLTDDKTLPSGQSNINLNGRDYLTFRNITFVSGFSFNIRSLVETSTNVNLLDCTFIAGGQGNNQALALVVGYGVFANWLIENCSFLCSGLVATVELTKGTGSHYDSGILFRNCRIIAVGYDWSVRVSSLVGGDNTGLGGGVDMVNCTVLAYGAMNIQDTGISTTYPCTVYNGFMWTVDSPVAAQSIGQLIEDYNIIISVFSVSDYNVTPGTHSIADGSYAPLINIGQEPQIGNYASPFLSPSVGSPLLGWGDQGAAVAYDYEQRMRPSGGQSVLYAAGAYERHDIGIEDTSVYDSAPASLKIIGPGDHDFELPVNPVSTNVTVMGYYNAAHSSGSPPQAQLLANPLIGLSSGSTLTMTEPEDTWEQLAFPTFVPTDYGVVTLRCISRSSSGSGAAWFDSITV